MEFGYDETTERLRAELLDFMTTHVYPAESAVSEEDGWSAPPVMAEL
ncbi:MAG: acyl-CoA dehydrogenase, partial [Hamadaea sp.]|nr:acyl-CoA dehydrogenase [Hamadaea sp.]